MPSGLGCLALWQGWAPASLHVASAMSTGPSIICSTSQGIVSQEILLPEAFIVRRFVQVEVSACTPLGIRTSAYMEGMLRGHYLELII